MKKLLPVICLISLWAACTQNTEQQTAQSVTRFQWESQKSGTTASLRGLSVVDSNVVWASGAEGTFLRTTDGGNTWQAGHVPDADSTDFRDIAAFDAETAYLLGAGSPALIYKTMDGGDTWFLQYQNTAPGIFFDAFDFWDENHGIAMSDPIDGHFVLIRTTDGGSHWEEVPAENMPAPAAGEAGFAASGTGLAVQGNRQVWFATGGKKARVFRSADGGLHWQVAETPMVQGTAATGIFSITFTDTLHGVAVGGNYQEPENNIKNACYTADGGTTWQLATTTPGGYRSGVAYDPGQKLLLTIGPSGSDFSSDAGQSWSPADTAGYHSVQFAKGAPVGWATGAQGRIAKIRLLNQAETD